MLNVPWFPEQDVTQFPNVESALTSPDGLLMFGGNLSPNSLQNAYCHGVFPWFEDDQPIMWWSPSIRAVIPTNAVHISKNMRKLLRSERYYVVADRDFECVIDACSDRSVTWIVAPMREAYVELHKMGVAHSVEVYDGDELVGGLYGVFVKNCFCGESMFSRKPNTSKLALISLAQFLLENNSFLIDCQLSTAHLESMGAVTMKRNDFTDALRLMKNNKLLTNTMWGALWQQF